MNLLGLSSTHTYTHATLIETSYDKPQDFDATQDEEKVQRALEEHLDVVDLEPRLEVIREEMLRLKEEREQRRQSQSQGACAGLGSTGGRASLLPRCLLLTMGALLFHLPDCHLSNPKQGSACRSRSRSSPSATSSRSRRPPGRARSAGAWWCRAARCAQSTIGVSCLPPLFGTHLSCPHRQCSRSCR